MPEHHRLQLLGHHLANAARLRVEFSLRLADGQLLTRPKPIFWLGVAHRDNQADFARLHQLLRALECPPALLDSHRTRSPYSHYQGVAVDLDSACPRGTLFMHCRDDIGERRLGLGWDGEQLQQSEYHVGRLTHPDSRDWLRGQVHGDYRALLSVLLDDARLVGQGGYWVQHKAERNREIYLTYPWRPPLEQLAPALNVNLPTPLPDTWLRYYAAPIRHIGLSMRHDPAPALTLYVTAMHIERWPESLQELETGVMRSALDECRPNYT